MSFENFIRQEQFFHHYQPIYDLKEERIAGYEVLLRTTVYPNHESTFSLAKKRNRLYELDSRSIHKAIQTYQSAGFTEKEGKLFLNVFPSTLLNKNFLSFIKNIMNNDALKSQHLVLEITEQEPITNFNVLKKIRASLKEMGISVAIDDVGSGSCELKKIIEIEPDYIKLDRYFAEGLYNSKAKQEMIHFFLKYCEKAHIHLVLEGLENPLDITASKNLGIPYGQGFALGKPNVLTRSVSGDRP
jgi:EAL domain-containing protein (putative c-di-GMP-specific phosphodiesterase class I)